MKNRVFTLLLAFSILLNNLSAWTDIGIILKEKAGEEDLKEILQGLSLLEKKGYQIIIPQEADRASPIARNYLEKGIQLFDIMKFNEAEDYLKRAANLFLKQLALPGSWEGYQNAIFYIGTLYLLTERYESAEKAFARLLSINKEFEPDRVKFSPRVLARFKEIKSKLSPLSGHTVIFCSEFDRVRLDNEIDIRKSERIDIRKGEHIVQNFEKGYFASFEVKNNAIIFAGRININNADDLRRVSGLCGLEELLVVERVGSELLVRSYKSNSPQKYNVDNSVLAETVEKPFYKKWWFWTGIGIMAGTAGTIFFITDNPRDKEDTNSVVIKW